MAFQPKLFEDPPKPPLEERVKEALLELVPRGEAREWAEEVRRRALERERPFLQAALPLLKEALASGEEVDPRRVEPVLHPVETEEDKRLFKALVLLWWSMPYTRAYGRRLAYLVKDRTNGKVMGLLSLMSPVLRMEARDRFLGIAKEDRTLAANLGLQAHRVGALPPYNLLLGGKLAAMALASREVREDYKRKYEGRLSLMEGRKLPADLVYVYTTGAYGKASIYERLRDRSGRPLVFRAGETKGEGVFHIPKETYDLVIEFLASQGFEAKRGYGGGPSQKLFHVKKACALLGLPNVALHNHRRPIYVFPHAENFREALKGLEEPRWSDLPFAELASWWLERWALPRAERALRGEAPDWRGFSPRELFLSLGLFG